LAKIHCPHCGKSNPPDNKFCGTCGTTLAGLSAPPPRRSGAEALPDGLPTPEGERKQVTVLIADIKGSLEILADRDPEDANRLLDAVLHIMMDAVHRYDGTVSQTRGDGVLAIFGAPLALEDHAVRACLASLAMQDAVNTLSERTMREDGIGVQVRVGLNSGEVVVRPMRNDRYMEYTAVGQTVHLAGRMEQLALPGKIFATAQTVRLAEHHVDARALGPVQVRGLTGAVDVCEIVGTEFAGVRSRFTNGRSLTPFVGRAAETEVLRGALLDAESGLGQTVTIVGEPGVGKSRLIHEFLQLAENAEWRVIESNVSGHSLDRPYAPFIELLRVNFRVEPADSPEQVRDKVLARLQMPDSGFPMEDTAALLSMLDALPMDPAPPQADAQLQRQTIFRAFMRLVRFESRRQPLVVVLEHLDQNDSMSMQLLAELVAQTCESRVLVLCTQRIRPGDDNVGTPPGQVLRLQPLSQDAFNEFMDGLLGDDTSLRPIKPYLRAHALGNPFFAEEIVRALTDAGVLAGQRSRLRLAGTLPEFQLPETLQALLAARIDRVPAEDKRILQCAAVAGSQVPLGLLRAITGLPDYTLRQSLRRLVRAELLMESRLYPEAEYSFANRLTHEVAYAELLRSQRGAIHAQIVEAIEAQYPQQLAEWLEPLANHAFQGQLWDKALGYLRDAALRARDRQDYAEAEQLFTRALHAAQQLAPTRETTRMGIDLRLDFRDVLELLGQHQRCAQYLQEAGEMAAAIGDVLRSGMQRASQAAFRCQRGMPAQGLESGREALAIGDTEQVLPLQATARTALGMLHHAQGQFTQAAEYLGWNAARLQGEFLGQRFGQAFLPSVYSRALLACCQAELGDFRQARSTALMAERLAAELNHPYSLGYALLMQGVVLLRQGEVVRAILPLQQAMGIPSVMDNPLGRTRLSCQLGFAMTLADRAEEGMELLERGTALAESKGFLAYQGQRLAYLAEAHLRAGRDAQAIAVAERALNLARAHGELAGEAYTRRVLAECALHRGHLDEAAERYRDCLQQAVQMRMLPLQASCHDGLARVAEAASDYARRRSHREKADSMADAMDMQLWTPPSGRSAVAPWQPQRYMRH
jgi:predicted ATPase/class 3 adenylate cyclase